MVEQWPFKPFVTGSNPVRPKLVVHFFTLILFCIITSLSFAAGKQVTISSKNNIKTGIEVTSPIIGTVYHSPEPGAKKFVEVGQKIKKGDTVMIVEAMKTMNHVPSTAEGTVKEICVEDGQPVEFGQTIIILE